MPVINFFTDDDHADEGRLGIPAGEVHRSGWLRRKQMQEVLMSQQRILVVEDDAHLGATLVSNLMRSGFEAVLACNAERAIHEALGAGYDLVILDLGLPDGDGFEVLKALRHRTSTPILVLTGQHSLESRVRSFQLGAVDWMAKPFYLEELVVRLRTRLGLLQAPAPARELRFGRLEVNLEAREARLDGELLRLTPIEYNVLCFLLERPGRVVSRQVLLDETLPPGDERSTRTVDSHVAHLRQKLGVLGAHVTSQTCGNRCRSQLAGRPGLLALYPHPRA